MYQLGTFSLNITFDLSSWKNALILVHKPHKQYTFKTITNNYDTAHSLGLSSFVFSKSFSGESLSNVRISCGTGDNCSSLIGDGSIGSRCNVGGVCSTSFVNTWICPLMAWKNGLYPTLKKKGNMSIGKKFTSKIYSKYFAKYNIIEFLDNLDYSIKQVRYLDYQRC